MDNDRAPKAKMPSHGKRAAIFDVDRAFNVTPQVDGGSYHVVGPTLQN
nr:J495 [uncultured bacterium]